MAKTSTIGNTSTTDLFIEDQLNEEGIGLTTGEKVALGFGIAGGVLVLGFIIYMGVRYVIEVHDSKDDSKDNNNKLKYIAIPTQNVDPDMKQLPAQQYAQYIQTPPPQPQPTTPQQPVQQPIQSSTITQDIDKLNQILNNMKQTTEVQNEIHDIQERVNSNINTFQANMNQLNNNQSVMANTMGEMAKGINIRNSQEYENLQNENALLKQQLNAANMSREKAESFANLMMGKHDQLAMQVNAPLSKDYLNALNSTPESAKYPNLNPDSGMIR